MRIERVRTEVRFAILDDDLPSLAFSEAFLQAAQRAAERLDRQIMGDYERDRRARQFERAKRVQRGLSPHLVIDAFAEDVRKRLGQVEIRFS